VVLTEGRPMVAGMMVRLPVYSPALPPREKPLDAVWKDLSSTTVDPEKVLSTLIARRPYSPAIPGASKHPRGA
jgi:hypothetical protein